MHELLGGLTKDGGAPPLESVPEFNSGWFLGLDGESNNGSIVWDDESLLDESVSDFCMIGVYNEGSEECDGCSNKGSREGDYDGVQSHWQTSRCCMRYALNSLMQRKMSKMRNMRMAVKVMVPEMVIVILVFVNHSVICLFVFRFLGLCVDGD